MVARSVPSLCKNMDKKRFNSIISPLLNFDKTSSRTLIFPSLSCIRRIQNNSLPNSTAKFIAEGVYSRGLFTAVQYRQNCILYFPKYGMNELGISFEFTGCVMAQFCCNGICYIAHIYLEPGHDTRQDWNNFVQNAAADLNNHYSDFILFKPYCSIIRTFYEEQFISGRVTISVCGIIEGNSCYSGIMNMNDCTLLHCTRINDVQSVIGALNNQNFNNVIIR